MNVFCCGSDIYSKSWLERVFFSSQRNAIDDKTAAHKDPYLAKDMITIDSIAENHEGLLWFWALWECAQFCVQQRLKTPLGKAQDTFVAIESKKT
jgi:PI-3-kinase-related kinase SMG-1